MTRASRRILPCACAAAALVLGTVAPASLARADDVPPAPPPGSAAPPGYRWTTAPHRALVDTGAALFFLGYAPAFGIGSAGSSNLLDSDGAQTRWLFLPLAGPFVLAGETHDKTADGLLIADGVLQVVGAGLVAAGCLWRTPTLVPTGDAGHRVELAVAPLFGGGSAGLAVRGAF